MQQTDKLVNSWKHTLEGWQNEDVRVISEAVVSLTVNGVNWISLMCTQTNLEALGAGFLFNEKVIESAGEIAEIRVCKDYGNVDIWLTHSPEKPKDWRRTSGCTGGVTRTELQISQNTDLDQSPIAAGEITKLMQQFLGSQDLHQAVGGVHSSAMSDGQSIRIQAEDIGRHNTLDKLSGRLLLEDIKMQRRILLTTGRISSEMLQKAVRLGAAIVLSLTSPTSLSIQMAEQAGITLVGYVRKNRFTVYSHRERVID